MVSQRRVFTVALVGLLPATARASDFGGMLSYFALLSAVPIAAVLSVIVAAGPRSRVRSAFFWVVCALWVALLSLGLADRRSGGDLPNDALRLVGFSATFLVLGAFRFWFWMK